MCREDFISVVGAYEHNLKDINIKIPVNKITTISGVSGSGKSSLIQSVIYSEYCRQERLKKKQQNLIP